MEKETEKQKSKDLLIPTMPLLSDSPSLQKSGSEVDADRFTQSLRDLKGLSSQLYHAADYFEQSFPKTARKKILLENTKRYVCEVIVTVVDHLGTVSSNLEQRVDANDEISQTEQRIDCLKQRLITCQQYALNLDLSSLLCSCKLPRHHRHYVLPFAGQPMFDADVVTKPSVANSIAGAKLAMVVPVGDDSSRIPKQSNASFGSLTEDLFKLGSSELKKKPLQRSNFLSFLRTNKRKA